MGRSFKYHRPRGVGLRRLRRAERAHAAPAAAPAASSRTPAPRSRSSATASSATSQNRWPSLAFDLGAVNDRLGSLFSAGFYYKTFMWPRAFWDRVYEPIIRNAAGLGVAPTEPDADRYASRFAHTDVLVVGAGPAGLAAALAAGRSGASVMLVDETAEPGGSLLSEPVVIIDGKPAWDWLAATLAELAALAERHGDAPHHGDRLLPPEPRSASPSASPTTSPPRPPTPRASGSGRSAPARSSSPRARSRSRWSSTATTAPA